MGLKMSASTQNVLGIIKIILILLLISPLFFTGGAEEGLPAARTANTSLPEYLKALGTGLVAVSFTYGGYQQSINFGGEVVNPARNIPRGIFIGICVIILLYLCINMAYVRVIGFEQLGQSKNIAALLAGKIFGAGAEKLLSVFFFLGVLAYVNVLLMSNPRVMFAMSEDGILPAAFQKTHPRTGALTVSLTAFTGICLLIIFWARAFDRILSFSIFLDCIGMVLSAATIFLLRSRSAKSTPPEWAPGHYQMRWYPLLPALFIGAYLLIAFSIAANYRENNHAAAVGLLMICVFGGVYFLLRKRTSDSNRGNT
jgi:APA family basic amino acid/polyamine antiporter